MQRSAGFSSSRKYRYWLRREWDRHLPLTCMIMLNPSIADAKRDDPTTTFCLGIARRDGFGRYIAVNLFALVGTDPRCIVGTSDPVGWRNDDAIQSAAQQADRVIVAWGVGGDIGSRGSDVLRMLRSIPLQCFGTNRNGSPRFPRALTRGVAVVPFKNPWARAQPAARASARARAGLTSASEAG